MLIPFATNSYRSLSLPISAQRALNCFAEKEPPDTKTPVSLFGAPGIVTFATCGAGPVRAMRPMGDLLYVVSGTTLYSVSSAGAVANIGSIGGATGAVALSDNGDQLFILNNEAGYLYRLTNNATLSNDGLPGDTTLTVAFAWDVLSMKSGDAVKISLDNGGTFSTTLNAAAVPGSIQLSTPLTGPSSKGNLVTDLSSTSSATAMIVVSAKSGAVSISVDVIDGFQIGDSITLALDAGQTFSTTIAGLTAGPVLKITAGLPSQASVGALVSDTAASLSAIADPSFYPAATVSYFDDYFVFDRAGTNQFFLSGLGDGATFPSIYLASALVNSDKVLSVLADHEMLLVFGSQSIETWYDAGSANFPLQRYDGATIERGIAAAATPIKEDNAVFFLGDDLVFYRLQGVMLQRSSTYAIEQAWSQYSTVSDAFTFSYTFGGHKFVVVTFPTAEATWVLDISTGLWHERDSLDASFNSIGRWRGNCCAKVFGKVLIGDLNTGQVGYLDWNTYTEFGSVFRVQAVGPAVRDDRKRVFMPRFELEVETGVGQNVTTSPVLHLAAALTGSAATGNQVADTGADAENSGVYTTLAADAASGAQSISVASAQDIGLGDSLSIELDTGDLFTTTVAYIEDPANPKIYLDYSNDGGHTFSTPQLPRSMGAAGQYLTRLRWLRLGQSRQRYMRVTMMDAVKRVIVAAYADTFTGT